LKIPRGNQNPLIEEEQTTQWSKEKVQKDKQRSTNHTQKTKYRVTRTQLKPGLNSGAPEVLAVPVPSRANLAISDKSWMRKGPGSVYDKWNISMVICDTGIP